MNNPERITFLAAIENASVLQRPMRPPMKDIELVMLAPMSDRIFTALVSAEPWPTEPEVFWILELVNSNINPPSINNPIELAPSTLKLCMAANCGQDPTEAAVLRM